MAALAVTVARAGIAQRACALRFGEPLRAAAQRLDVPGFAPEAFARRAQDAVSSSGRQFVVCAMGEEGGWLDRAALTRLADEASASALPVEEEAPKVGVTAFVARGDSVLLVQRARPPAMGQWALPGGRMEAGETLAQCAVRELAEECGLEAQAVEDGAFAATDGIHLAEGVHYVVCHVEVRETDPEKEAVADDDAAAVMWAPMDALPENTTPMVAEVVGVHLSNRC